MPAALIIPERHQSEHIGHMASAINAMTPRPDYTVIVMDRESYRERTAIRGAVKSLECPCAVIENDSESGYMGRPPMHFGQEAFLTGHCRELGLAASVSAGCDRFIFADGDCIPQSRLIPVHLAAIDTDAPVICAGKRIETIWNMDDQRCASKEQRVAGMFDFPVGTVVSDKPLVDSGVIWTCDFSMNAAAVAAVRRVNELCYGRSEVFSSLFSGTWGGEDGFLGLEAYYSGVAVKYACGPSGGVIHQFHARPDSKYGHSTFLEDLEIRREELMSLLSARGLLKNNQPFVKKNFLRASGAFKKDA